MKGMIFTEFIEIVNDKFGYNVTETIVERANLPSGGVYTAVGTYDAIEMVSKVLSKTPKNRLSTSLGVTLN